MMKDKELKGIANALNDHYGGQEITTNHLVNVAILKNYCPDCPGWQGDIALVVHGGGSCFKDILYKIDGKWTWVESMNEGDYKCNLELM
jgi:hypothetical protein